MLTQDYLQLHIFEKDINNKSLYTFIRTITLTVLVLVYLHSKECSLFLFFYKIKWKVKKLKTIVYRIQYI